MDNNDLMERLEGLKEANTIESNKEIIELINDNPGYFLSRGESSLDLIRVTCEANILKLEIENASSDDFKNLMHLKGKLIFTYHKLEKLETDNNKKMEIRYQINELTKSQIEDSKNYRHSGDVKLPEKVALKIKEIAKTIKVFLNEKDVIKKVLNIIKETGYGIGSSVLLFSGIGLLVQTVVGVPFSLSMIPQLLPMLGYLGLSSTIRNTLNKTQFQHYEYYQSDKYKKYVEDFTRDNKEKLDKLSKHIEERESIKDNRDLVNLNNVIIAELDEICSLITDQGLREAYELQALYYLRENKKLLKDEKELYLDEKSDDLDSYNEYNKMLAKTNIEIFKRENSIKEACIHAGKGIVFNTAVMALAKGIITAINPTNPYAIRGLKSFMIPVALATINGIVDIPTYSNKLKYKETSENVTIDVEEKEKWDELFGDKRLQMA